MTVLVNYSIEHNIPRPILRMGSPLCIECEAGREHALSGFLERLYQNRGWDFRNYKKASLKRRISRRLADYNISSYKKYYKILESNPAEYDKLFSTITIKVSEFFRDPEVFDLLKDLIIREFSGAEELKIWCCGCAGGEEAYSLTILLQECVAHKNLPNKKKIFATDIDNGALETGRTGIYREELVVNVNNTLREKYFTETDKGYKVRYDIRNMVRFGKIDIVKDPPLSKIDILFCRNLFIYFNHTLQKEVLQKLNFALKPDGILVLGKAEVLPAAFLSRGYKEMSKGSKIYRKG